MAQHTEDAALEYSVGLQAIHDEGAAAPAVVLYVLAEQALHAVVPGLDQKPVLQHTPEPGLLNLEAGHNDVADDPIVGQKVFEGQLTQEVEENAPNVVL
jgi:hypothetical protein